MCKTYSERPRVAKTLPCSSTKKDSKTPSQTYRQRSDTQNYPFIRTSQMNEKRGPVPFRKIPRSISVFFQYKRMKKTHYKTHYKRDVHFSLSKNYHSLPFHRLKRRWAPSGNVMCIKVHQSKRGGKISGNLFFWFFVNKFFEFGALGNFWRALRARGRSVGAVVKSIALECAAPF